MKSGPNSKTSSGHTAGEFRPETLEEVAFITQFDWFPSDQTHRSASDPKMIALKVPTGYEVSLVRCARSLSMQARTGDEDALLRLFVMAAAAQLELWLLMRDKPHLLEAAAQHSAAWPMFSSPFTGIASIYERSMGLFKVGRLILQSTKSQGKCAATSSICAFQLLTFMVVARRGLAPDKRYEEWTSKCMVLQPLSDKTWTDWWLLAREIANKMYPDLHKRMYGKEAGTVKKNLGDAIHQLKTPFSSLWGLFIGVEQAPRGGDK